MLRRWRTARPASPLMRVPIAFSARSRPWRTPPRRLEVKLPRAQGGWAVQGPTPLGAMLSRLRVGGRIAVLHDPGSRPHAPGAEQEETLLLRRLEQSRVNEAFLRCNHALSRRNCWRRPTPLRRRAGALRPPLASDSLEELPDGRVKDTFRHAWRDGTSAVIMEPLAGVERTSARSLRSSPDRAECHEVPESAPDDSAPTAGGGCAGAQAGGVGVRRRRGIRRLSNGPCAGGACCTAARSFILEPTYRIERDRAVVQDHRAQPCLFVAAGREFSATCLEREIRTERRRERTSACIPEAACGRT